MLEVKDEEIGRLKARLSLADAEAAEAINLRIQVSALKTSQSSLLEHNSVLQKERDSLGAQVAELRAKLLSFDNLQDELRDKFEKMQDA